MAGYIVVPLILNIMNTKINIVVIQLVVSKNFDASIDNLLEKISRIKYSKNTIVVLHELSFYRYIAITKSKKYFPFALKLSDSIIDKFIKVCNHKNIHLLLPIFEKKEKKFYNSAIVISPTRKIIGVYRKQHIPEEVCYHEKYYFSKHKNTKNVFDLGFCKLGIGICWDQWYPSTYKSLAMNKADLILFPTSIGTAYRNNKIISLKSEQKMWRMIMQSHSLIYNLPIVVANRIGIESSLNRKISFWGSSFITNHSGEIIQNLKNKPGVMRCQINTKDRHIHQKKWGFI